MNRNKMNCLGKLPALLLPWFDKNARKLPWRETKDPYRIWLSEIMLQQTRVEAVKEYYTRFLNTFPTVEHLANGEESVVLKLWEGLGYYSRARNLHKAAKIIVSDYDGTFPENYGDILSLPGVGKYTAGAISSICFDAPTPAVDGNVLRVISRITELSDPIDAPKTKEDVTHKLASIYPSERPGDFTQSLMELGATVCLPNGAPLCDMCPAKDICAAQKNSTQQMFPIRSPKKARKQEQRTVFILTCGEYVAINKRPQGGLLGGLWEFPNIPGALDKTGAVRYLVSKNAAPSGILKSVNRTHIFTHIEWHMIGYYFTCDHVSDSFTWVTKDDLASKITLPTAFKQFCSLL